MLTLKEFILYSSTNKRNVCKRKMILLIFYQSKAIANNAIRDALTEISPPETVIVSPVSADVLVASKLVTVSVNVGALIVEVTPAVEEGSV